MADDGHVVAARASKASAVALLLFDVCDYGTFGDGAKGKNVADCQSRVLASVDELACIHALVAMSASQLRSFTNLHDLLTQ